MKIGALRMVVGMIMAGGLAVQAMAAVTEETTSTYAARPWGELGEMWLETAPYPDDSRTTGFASSNGVFEKAGHYDDSTVAVGIPKGYRKDETVDFVLYYHGWTNTAPKALDLYRLGEQIEASGRNAIVVVPQGPKDSKDSGIGKIEKPDGFARMMSDVMAVLVRDGKLNKDVKMGRLVISGHSGGYMPVAKTLAVGGMDDHIDEVWLWDAAYGQWDAYARFMLKYKDKRLRSFFTDHLEDDNVRIMSLLNLGGRYAMLVDEDDLTSASSPVEGFESAFHVEGAKPGVEEFDLLAKNVPLFFMHTKLSHSGVVRDRNYFERLARSAKGLKAR